jgi:hypothetical protein
MKTVEWKKNVSSCDEFSLWITSCGVSRKRIVARHMCMNNFESMLGNQATQPRRAKSVESISQWQSFDTFARDLQVLDKRRLRSNHSKQFMSSSRKRIG